MGRIPQLYMGKLRDIGSKLALAGGSFRGRLLTLLVTVSIIQVVAAAATYNGLQSKPVEDRVRAELVSALQTASPLVAKRLEASTEALEMLRTDATFLRAIEKEETAAIAERLAAAEFENVWVSGPEGEVLAGEQPLVPVLDNSLTHSREAQLLGEVHAPVVFDEDFFEELATFTGTSVFVANADTAVTANVEREESLPVDVRLVEQERPGDLRADLPVVTVQGEVAGVSVDTDEVPSDLGENMQRIDLFGAEQVAFVRPLGSGTELVIGATIPGDTVDSLLAANQGKLVMFLALMLVLAIVVSVLVSRSVASILGVFVRGTRRVAEGELDARLPVVGQDELAVLSSSFNTMAENLQDRVDSLEEARHRLRRQVEHFGRALENAHNIEEMLLAVCTVAIESTVATHARFWTMDELGNFRHSACIGLRPRDRVPCDLEKFAGRRSELLATQEAPYWLALPVLNDDRPVGVLTLVSLESPFSEDEQRLARRLARQAALALDNAHLHAKLKDQATRDSLTGLPNHRAMQDRLEAALQDAVASGQPMGVAMLDVDNFKGVNDTYGHKIGDDALKAVAAALRTVVSAPGFVARYGGEEFTIIMPGVDAGAAVRIADRVREEISRAEVPLDDGGVLKLTASFGVTNLDQYAGNSTPPRERLLEHADEALYAAKHGGKNRVELYEVSSNTAAA